MPEVETKIIPNEKEDEDEDGYIEEEDEDFQPEKDKLGGGSDDSDASDGGDDYDDGVNRDKGRNKVDYSRIESESGGLIKTRRARQAEEEYAKTHKYESLTVESIPAKVNSIWEELQEASKNRLLSSSGKVGSVLDGSKEARSTTAAQQEDKILIERNYKFAGETVHEKNGFHAAVRRVKNI